MCVVSSDNKGTLTIREHSSLPPVSGLMNGVTDIVQSPRVAYFSHWDTHIMPNGINGYSNSSERTLYGSREDLG
ncbi:hypothetical protein TSUD_07940 [Trifolium subterraneum]|nr:hypothetical protein TSUD_07940 [Trifolium subterraneum]